MILDSTTNSQLRERFNPDGSPLRVAQLQMLDILNTVDDICRRNGITYWLSSGTLIGAARHGGFIPWDDDLDIEMLRPDLERFCEIAPRELPANYSLQTSATDPMFFLSLAKVRNNDIPITSASTELEAHYRFNGMFIDLLPIEPSTSRIVHRVAGKLAYWGVRLINSAYGRPYAGAVRGAVKGFISLLGAVNGAVQPIAPGERLRHVFPSTFNKPRYRSDLFPLGEIEFEGRMYPAPANVDRYLRRIYGDWTSLPNLDSLDRHTVL